MDRPFKTALNRQTPTANCQLPVIHRQLAINGQFFVQKLTAGEGSHVFFFTNGAPPPPTHPPTTPHPWRLNRRNVASVSWHIF